jgi:hypothetical protein
LDHDRIDGEVPASFEDESLALPASSLPTPNSRLRYHPKDELHSFMVHLIDQTPQP